MTRAVVNRWPTWLALGLWALTAGGDVTDAGVRTFGEVLLLLPLLYLVVAAMRRRGASWPALVALLTAAIAVDALNVAAPSVLFAVVALVVLVWGGVRGRLHRPGRFRVQALGMAGFGGLALAGLVVDPDVGRYLVAGGWLLHGLWDLAHLRADAVVSRSYAEWCGVVDVLLAAEVALSR